MGPVSLKIRYPSSLKKQRAKAVSKATRILREESGDPKRSFAGFE